MKVLDSLLVSQTWIGAEPNKIVSGQVVIAKYIRAPTAAR